MKKIFLMMTASFLAAYGVKAQYPTIGQSTVPGLGIGLPVGANVSDAALHIKAAANTYYSSGNGQQLFYGETANAPGDNIRIMNAKGGVGNTFSPLLMGTMVSDAAVSSLGISANIANGNDVLNTSPLMLFSVRKGFTPQTSIETAGGGTSVANRPLYQWNNNSTSLMTMTPTTAANGDARMAFGYASPAVLPTYKFELITPGGGTGTGAFNDGLRITNNGGASAMLRLKATSTGGREWAVHSSGIANGVGAGHFFVYDATAGFYRMFIKGPTGNVGMGKDNSLTTNPLLQLDINTNSQNDGIRVTQTGTTAATLSLVGGAITSVGTAPGQARRWALMSTGTSNTPTGAGHLLFWDWTTNVERMRINQNGFVGINTISGGVPTHLLHVKSNTVNGANVDPVRFEKLNAATDSSVVTIDNSGVLHTRSISTLSSGISNSCTTINQVPRVIDALGNLSCGSIYDNGTNIGIGTTSPLHKVHIDNGALMLSGAVPGFGGPQLLFSDNLSTHPNGRWAIEYNSVPPVGGLNFWTPFPGGTAGNYSLFLRDGGKVGMGVTDDNSSGDPNYSATAFAGNYRLYVKGGILTDKVKVAVYNTANWADYVFAPDYKLKSLEEVEAFTKANKHLPGMQSAAELVKDGGIDVSEMLTKQMEKIEELTLYMIEMKKENTQLKKDMQDLKTVIASPSK